MVAGGRSNNYLSSVLTLLPGATAWTPLASLPRTLRYAHASIVGGKMRVTGGRDEYMIVNGRVIDPPTDQASSYCTILSGQYPLVQESAKDTQRYFNCLYTTLWRIT